MNIKSLNGTSFSALSLPMIALLTLGGTAAAMSGCRQAEPKVETTQTSKPLAPLPNTAVAAVDHQAELFTTQRSEFLTTMKADLAALNRGIDEHEKQVEKTEGLRLTAGRESVAQLRQLSVDAGKQVVVVTTAPAATWTETKIKSEKMCSDLKVKLSDAKAQLEKVS